LADRCQFGLATPEFGPQDSGKWGSLQKAWSCCPGADTFTGKIFEESKSGPVEAIGFGIFVLVTDEFMHQAKQTPFFGLVRSSLIESQTEKTTFV